MFSAREILQLLLLIGYFRMIRDVMTTLDVEVEPPFGVQILKLSADPAWCEGWLQSEQQSSISLRHHYVDQEKPGRQVKRF